MRESKRKQEAKITTMDQDSRFMQVLLLVSLRLFSASTDDVVPLIQQEMKEEATRRNFVDLLRLWQDRERDMQIPWYSEVVLGLYELLTRPYMNEASQRVVWAILRKCSNHDFQAFLRLTNPRNNSNHFSRVHAIQILREISETGQTRNLGPYILRWQHGAQRRIQQLERAGQLP